MRTMRSGLLALVVILMATTILACGETTQA